MLECFWSKSEFNRRKGEENHRFLKMKRLDGECG